MAYLSYLWQAAKIPKIFFALPPYKKPLFSPFTAKMIHLHE
jgi:hypothetical protein